MIDADGNCNDRTKNYLTTFLTEFDEHARRVLSVLPPKR